MRPFCIHLGISLSAIGRVTGRTCRGVSLTLNLSAGSASLSVARAPLSTCLVASTNVSGSGGGKLAVTRRTSLACVVVAVAGLHSGVFIASCLCAFVFGYHLCTCRMM